MRNLINYLYKNNEIDENNFEIAWIERFGELKTEYLEIWSWEKDIKILINKETNEFIVENSKDINYSILIITQIESINNYNNLEYLINKYNEIKKNIKIKKNFKINEHFKDYSTITPYRFIDQY